MLKPNCLGCLSADRGHFSVVDYRITGSGSKLYLCRAAMKSSHSFGNMHLKMVMTD